MATLEDVAKRAGVSIMTVSRVMNNSGYVKPETRKKVEKAALSLNFQPNMLARALVTKRTQIIACAMINISDPFHSQVAKGMEACCYEKGYTLILCDVNSVNRENDYLNMFTMQMIDGVVFHHLAITNEQVQLLEDANVSCLLMDNEIDLPTHSSIRTDNYGGAVMAVKHLISKGHQRIGCIHGVLKKPFGKDIPYEDTFQFDIWIQRTNGFIDTMLEHGLNADLLYQGNGLMDIMQEQSEYVLDMILNESKPPTAIYCQNDIIALILLSTMSKRGLRSPDDLAIVGHDGLEICKLMHPYVTTVVQPQYRMGHLAADLLIRQIEQQSIVERLTLAPTLSIGETT